MAKVDGRNAKVLWSNVKSAEVSAAAWEGASRVSSRFSHQGSEA